MYFHFTGEDTEKQQQKKAAQGHTTNVCLSLDFLLQDRWKTDQGSPQLSMDSCLCQRNLSFFR